MKKSNAIKNHAGKFNYKKLNRLVERESMKFTDKMRQVPENEWPVMAPTTGKYPSIPLSVWRSKKFLACVWQEPTGYIRISIHRTIIDSSYQFVDGICWDDLQRIKNEIGFSDKDCIELYPAESDVVNVANIRHLFVLPEKSPYNWSVSIK
jgi:hypothetical protein